MEHHLNTFNHLNLLSDIAALFLFQLTVYICFESKVMEVVTDAGMTQLEAQVIADTVAVTAVSLSTDQDVSPPAPPKKRLLETDTEVRRA